MISVPNQLVGAYEGQTLTLECQSEAYPKSINYWTKENGEIIAQGKFGQNFMNKIQFSREKGLSLKIWFYQMENS